VRSLNVRLSLETAFSAFARVASTESLRVHAVHTVSTPFENQSLACPVSAPSGGYVVWVWIVD
jgi:hypothetical protein